MSSKSSLRFRKTSELENGSSKIRGTEKPFVFAKSLFENFGGNFYWSRTARYGLLCVMSETRLSERFWRNVDRKGPNDCWIWKLCRDSNGYGICSRYPDSGSCRAHRLAFEITKGPIPEGFYVLHRCDNRPCVNPRHLRLGTQLDNMRERSSRGRCNSRKGAEHYKAKLTEDQVREIRNNPEVKQWYFALKFGVPQPTISRARRMETWKHIS